MSSRKQSSGKRGISSKDQGLILLDKAFVNSTTSAGRVRQRDIFAKALFDITSLQSKLSGKNKNPAKFRIRALDILETAHKKASRYSPKSPLVQT